MTQENGLTHGVITDPWVVQTLSWECQFLKFWSETPSSSLYRKIPKISDTRKFAVITLKVEQDGFF